MILIGEKLNSSIPSALEAMKAADGEAVRLLIEKQAEGGADYLDLNAALTGREEEMLLSMAQTVREKTDCGLMLDSPDPAVLSSVLKRLPEKCRVILNSVNGDTCKGELSQQALAYGASLVCMPMLHGRIPETARERADIAKDMIACLLSLGFQPGQLYIDVLVSSGATEPEAAKETLDTIRLVKSENPGVLTICGLSNVSFGWPKRAVVNSAFLSMAQYAGLDAVIADPTKEALLLSLKAGEALLGEDEFGIEYIGYTRSLG